LLLDVRKALARVCGFTLLVVGGGNRVDGEHCEGLFWWLRMDDGEWWLRVRVRVLCGVCSSR
jgi:hypothetical protein